MSVDKALKMFGAMLLLVSVTLPMATCTRYEDAEGMRIEVDDVENLPEGVHKVVQSEYALENFDPLDGGEWLKVLAFLWPVLTLAPLWWKPRGPVAVAVRVLELLLVAGSFFLIDFISSFLVDRRAIGAYLAFLALGLYGVGAIWSDVSLYRSWKTGRRT
jgi:hypothetical protein